MQYKSRCCKCGYIKSSSYTAIAAKPVLKCQHVLTWHNKRIRRIFRDMKERCYNSNNKSYRFYGEKGIRVCDEWINNPSLFETWSLENGYDDDMTIDRIDSSKDYSPNNCRWIDMRSNSKYKSTTVIIDVDGEKHTGREWSDVLKLGTNVINSYIRKYGINNTVKFIRKYKASEKIHRKSKQSYFDLYMNM